MRLAQETAFKKKKKVEVVWRGYRKVIEPAGPVYNNSELRAYLVQALAQILKESNAERFAEEEEKVYQSLCRSLVPQKTPPRQKRKCGNVTDMEVF